MEKWLWTQKQNIGPSPRYSQVMTYDSAKQRVLLFGGRTGENFLNDTWQWDGSDWTQVADTGPSPRFLSTMAYDSSREKAVLFGGYANSSTITSILNDTWEWDGTEWTQVADTGPAAIGLNEKILNPPSPSSGYIMSYDSTRQKMMLFGGWNPNRTHNDTWEWDGTEWTQVADIGPSSRGLYGMVYDTSQQKMVLFDGETGETWQMTNNNWVKVQDTGPGSVAWPIMVFSAKGIILFQSQTDPNFPAFVKTWQWGGTFWKQKQDIGPLPRSGYSMAFDTQRDRTVLFGGMNGDFDYGDTWELKIESA